LQVIVHDVDNFFCIILYLLQYIKLSHCILLHTFRRVKEIEASRAPQVLQIDHDDSVDVSSSDDDDGDLSDDEIAACSKPFYCPAPLPQPDSLPGIESGQHSLCLL